METRKKVVICNILIALLCIGAVVGYFLSPLWRIGATVKMTADLGQYLKNVTVESIENSDDDAETKAEKKDIAEAVFNSLVEKGTSFDFVIKITTIDALKTTFSQSSATVDEIFEKNVDDLIESLSETLDETVDAVIEHRLTELAKERLNASLSSVGNDDYIAQILESAGVNDDFIAAKIAGIIKVIRSGDASLDSVVNAMMSVFDDIEDLIVATNLYEGDVLFTEEDRVEIKGMISDMLLPFTDEYGKVDIDKMINMLLSAYFGGGSISSPSTDPEDPSSQTNVEQVKQELKDLLMEVYNDHIRKFTVIAMTVITAIFLISAAVWAFTVLKLIIKTSSDNPAIKLKLPIWFGWTPFLIFFALPAVGIILLRNLLSGKLNLNVNIPGEFVNTIMSSTRFFLWSSGIIAFIISMVLLVFSFYYSSLRKKLTRR